MKRKVFKVGNTLVVSLSEEVVESLGLSEGSEVKVTVRQAEGYIAIEPLLPQLGGIDAVFAQQLHDFIELYRPALEALAR